MDDPYQPRIWRLEDHFLPVEQLPPLLYHVRHAHSLTSFGPNGDIYTSHPIKSLFIASRDKLDDLVRWHLDWQSRGPSHFISVFFHKAIAWSWGIQRSPLRVLYTIDSQRLPRGWPIVCAGVHTHNPFDAEFVFLTYIPYDAIVDIETIHSVPGLESSVELGAPVVPVHYPALPQVLGPPPRFPPPPYQEVHALCLGSQAAPMPDPAQTPSLAPIGTRPPNEERVPPLPGSGRNAPTPPAPAPSPPPNRSPPSYEAPHHFASPPYTTPAQYITPVPPVGTLPPVPPAAESGTYAQSDPGGPRAPGQESSTAPSATSPAHTSPGHTPGHLTPSQIMSGQNLPAVPVVGFPPPPLPQPIDETTASEPPVSSAPEPSTASDPGPSDQPEPVRNAETPGQSQPERAFGSNSGTPGRPNISFFAEDSDMEVSDAEGSPSFTRAIKSKPSSPAPSGPSGAKLNFFAED